MAGVLTTESTVKCGHGSGKVSTKGTDKLTVNGKKALLKAGIMDKTVSGCGTMDKSDSSGTPLDKACTKVYSVSTTGEAKKLTVGGRAVMLELNTGETDGMGAQTTPTM